MESIDTLHRETRRLVLDARRQLETLEFATKTTSPSPLQASSHILQAFRNNIETLSQHTYQLKSMITTEPPSRHGYWQARVRGLSDEIAELSSGERRIATRFYELEREALLGREDEMLRQRRKGLNGSLALDIDIEEGQSLKRSDKGADNIMNVGRGVLEMLGTQGGRLRGIKGKVTNLLEHAGVNRDLIRKIERRDWGDTVLLGFLIVALLCFVGLIYLWKHWR